VEGTDLATRCRAGDVMGESLDTGTRRLPTQADVRHALGVEVTRTADPGTLATPALHRRPSVRR